MNELPAVQGARCPVCACPVGGEARLCPRCQAPHHADCWDYAGGCAIFGCADPSLLVPPHAQSEAWLRRHVTAWLWLFRCQWLAYSAVGLALASFAVVAAASAVVGFAFGYEGWAADFHMVSAVLGYVAAALLTVGVCGFCLVIAPAWAVQRALERRLGRPLVPVGRGRPHGSVPQVEQSRLGRFVTWSYRAAQRFLEGALVAQVALGLYHAGLAPHPSANVLDNVVPAVLFTLGARFLVVPLLAWPTRLRVAYLQTVQNRLLASFKG